MHGRARYAFHILRIDMPLRTIKTDLVRWAGAWARRLQLTLLIGTALSCDTNEFPSAPPIDLTEQSSM